MVTTNHWRRRVKRLERAQIRRNHNPAALAAAIARLGGHS